MTTGADWVDQARRLLDTFVQRQGASPAGPSPAGPSPAGGSGPGAHGSDCTWCPLCQAAAVVRGNRPEVTVALADVLTATATALRAFAESAQPAEAGAPARTDDPGAESPPVVQRIEIA